MDGKEKQKRICNKVEIEVKITTFGKDKIDENSETKASNIDTVTTDLIEQEESSNR